MQVCIHTHTHIHMCYGIHLELLRWVCSFLYVGSKDCTWVTGVGSKLFYVLRKLIDP